MPFPKDAFHQQNISSCSQNIKSITYPGETQSSTKRVSLQEIIQSTSLSSQLTYPQTLIGLYIEPAMFTLKTSMKKSLPNTTITKNEKRMFLQGRSVSDKFQNWCKTTKGRSWCKFTPPTTPVFSTSTLLGALCIGVQLSMQALQTPSQTVSKATPATQG